MTEVNKTNSVAIREPVAVLGYGVEGRATLNYLRRQGVKDVHVLDAREPADLPADVPAVVGEGYDQNLQRFATVFRSPGIRPDREPLLRAKEAGTVITTALTHFLERCPAPVIGITGTVGKGTAASLAAAMLESSGFKTFLGGNIGQNPLDFLEEIASEDRVVLEISSFQAFDIGVSPKVAVILKTTSEHLDWHLDQDEYLRAKAQLLARQTADDYVIFNDDAAGSRRIASGSAARRLPFSTEHALEEGLYIEGDRFVLSVDGTRTELPLDPRNIRLQGRFNWENIAAALLAVRLSGADLAKACRAGEEFAALPHRLETVGWAGDVAFVNDSYATRPDAAMAALSINEEAPLAVILGGSEKNADFTELAEAVHRHPSIVHVALIGQTAQRLHDILMQTGTPGFDIVLYEDLEPAMDGAHAALHGRGTVLMAPGCASFGLFANYKVRGERFRARARHIIENMSKI